MSVADPGLRNRIERLLESMVKEAVKQAECDEDRNHDCAITSGRASSLARDYAVRILSELGNRR
jgi:hypothetical protein